METLKVIISNSKSKLILENPPSSTTFLPHCEIVDLINVLKLTDDLEIDILPNNCIMSYDEYKFFQHVINKYFLPISKKCNQQYCANEDKQYCFYPFGESSVKLIIE